MYTKTVKESGFLRETRNITDQLCVPYFATRPLYDYHDALPSAKTICELMMYLDNVNSDENNLLANYVKLSNAQTEWNDLEETTVNYDTRLYIAKVNEDSILEPPKGRKDMPLIAEVIKKQNPRRGVQAEVFTYKNTLYCLTNKTLNNISYVFLKLIQYNLFKDKFHNFEKATIKILDGIVNENLRKTNEGLAVILNPATIKRRSINITQIKNVINQQARKKQRDLESRISNLNDDLERYYRAYMQTQNDITELQIEYNAWMQNPKAEKDPTDLTEYLINHPFIKQIHPMSGQAVIKLYFEAPILYYSDTKIEDQKFGRIESHSKILDIFLTHEYELWVTVAVAVNLLEFNCHSIEQNNISNYLAHPHIARYGCFGTHLDDGRAYQRNENYIGYIDQITGAVNEINFGDGIVISTMLTNLANSNKRTWKSKKTGELMTTAQVLEEIENGKTQNE